MDFDNCKLDCCALVVHEPHFQLAYINSNRVFNLLSLTSCMSYLIWLVSLIWKISFKYEFNFVFVYSM